ncbi:RNA polymerase sporulation sigma factor SigH [Vallitaleaceae bacterium 9-2]
MEQLEQLEAFQSMVDEELVEQIRQDNDLAIDFLMNKYKLLVEKKAKTYFLMGASKEDIIQEGMIGLFKAIRDYNPNKEASFFSFADLCITRQMITAVKAATRQKHMPLNTYVSLNKPSYQDEEDRPELIDSVSNEKVTDPEELLIGRENLHIIEYELTKKLSPFEKEVLQLYIDGTSYTEVAAIMKRPIKSIDNALQRIKKKVEKILLEKNV